VHDCWTGVSERVSVASDGSQANGASRETRISADGRFVAFACHASNLVPGDTNGLSDAFVHDRLTGETWRVNVSTSGDQADGETFHLNINDDGRFVVFESRADNLVPGDTNTDPDAFVRDWQTGITERVSVSSSGEQGNCCSGHVGGFAISADANYVAFGSTSTNLVPGDTNNAVDVFLRDRLASTTERVSVSGPGEQADAGGGSPDLSSDGRYMAFLSSATNLVPGDTNGVCDVFVRDLLASLTERVSVSSTGEQANGETPGFPYARISADGRCVVFQSDATNLVPGDTNGLSDIFVRVRWRFRDVPPEEWAFDEVEACVDANVVKGYSDETYRPSDPVTRDQMAVYISRALVIPSGDAGVPPGPSTATFSDVPTDYWAYKWVEYAFANSIVGGYWDATYRPTNTVDRGQMAVFIARSIVTPHGDEGLIGYTPPATPTFSDVATDYWAYEYVEYIAQDSVSVTHGYPDHTYRPTQIVGRGEMAVYVQRAFNLPG
jgi:Tol biopolymer transport system component